MSRWGRTVAAGRVFQLPVGRWGPVSCQMGALQRRSGMGATGGRQGCESLDYGIEM